MSVKVVVTLQAKPGRRAELAALVQRLVAEQGPAQRGFLGSQRYEAIDDPDTLVEIAEWESVEARAEHMQAAAAAGTYAPVVALLAAPFQIRLLRSLG